MAEQNYSQEFQTIKHRLNYINKFALLAFVFAGATYINSCKYFSKQDKRFQDLQNQLARIEQAQSNLVGRVEEVKR